MIFQQLFDENTSTYTYIIADSHTGEAIIIDPVFEQQERDLQYIQERNLNLRYILETHVHADHVTSAAAIHLRTGAQIVTAAGAGVHRAHLSLSHSSKIHFGSQTIEVLETPGHTAHCLSFLLNGDMVFTGDALLIDGTGRTDFQGGSANQLYHSITNHLFTLPDQVKVFPGHDYKGRTSSTIGQEKASNHRLANKTLEEYVELMDNLTLALPKHIERAVPENQHSGWHSIVEAINEQEVSPQWVAKNRHKLCLLDVRGPQEFKENHLPSALNIPLDQLNQSIDQLPKDKVIITICRSGRRSLTALNILSTHAMVHAWSMKGGMIAWQTNHLEVA